MKRKLYFRQLALLAACVALCSSAMAQETDPRLHSNGPGWRLEKAKIDNDKLPRVLLIGDSILNGYMNGVIRALRGKANVDAWVNPYHQANAGLPKMTAEVLSNGPYDIIHFNMGLHGWKPGQFKDGEFEPATRRWVEVMRANSPKATLIWASSTPVTTKTQPYALDPEINPIIVEHNRMAAKVMGEMNVPVNGLYSLLSPSLELAAGDQFHWKEQVGDTLAKQVVKTLAPVIKLEGAELDAALQRVDEPEWTRAAFRFDCRAVNDVRLDFKSVPDGLKAITPEWAGEKGKLLLLIGPISHAWKRVTFSFAPTKSGQVNLGLVGDCRMPKMIWTEFDNVAVEGTTLRNGDFEELDAAGNLAGWQSFLIASPTPQAPVGGRTVRVGPVGESVQQPVTVEAGKPVTVSFDVRIGNSFKP